MSYEEKIQTGVELLKLCQKLQSEKDGVARPEPGVTDKTKPLDKFAIDVTQSITYMASLHQLIPINTKLAELGRKLELEGKIAPRVGDDYSQLALQYVLKEHGITD
ncbi:hypothetical protein [Limnohabitans sp. INBF002]|uniref:hypothetical protein n=1 Tax=Limnohabitans sp. INBF002 TaxID=2986280 RepID=UPI002376EFC6|nr:hypothetical protein [Limnohabitans sp. INBF002]BDU53371.1 hypothetical protein LINBF2_16060 [Limnohabitans sp. INBF002]